MSCPKDTNLQVRDQFGNLIAPIVQRISKCKGKKSFYPSFTPVINSISVNTSIVGVYTVVYINGSNFLPPCNGDTYVNFGSFTHLPITFYSSFNISFVVPLNAVGGIYNIKVVNVYNDNFSLPVSQSYPGIPNYSNAVSYRIYNMHYTLSGIYTVSSDSNYNTIINFLGNGNFTILNNINNIPINYIAVGGGGGGAGGAYNISTSGGGGGGGGGVATGTFGLQNSYSILIGNGGSGGAKDFLNPGNGTNGGSTQITGVINVSGGAFGRSCASSPFGKGGNSGNGGAGGTGNTNPGGNGVNGGGGGGGQWNSPIGFNGGNGSTSITSVYSFGTAFGAGGGGGGGGSGSITSTSLSGTGGNIYAGNGGNGTTGTVGSGTAHYGGGGGGGISGSSTATTTKGGNGGSGRVVLYFNN